MRVTLQTPIEKLSEKQRTNWIPKMLRKGLGFVGSSFIQLEDLGWQPADAGVLVYIHPQALAARLADHLPDASLVPWALAYMQGDNDFLRIAAGISGEQPLEEVAYTASELVVNINTRSFGAINCANQLSSLWRAGLIQFTIPVRFPHD